MKRSVAGILLCLSAASALAPEVGLTWNPNAESDLAGYKLYRGTSPGQYDTIVTTTDTMVISPTISGQTNYFAVTAFNTNNLESEPSNVVFVYVSDDGEVHSPPSQVQGLELISTDLTPDHP